MRGSFQFILSMGVVLSTAMLSFAAEENYCADQAAALAWEQLVKVSPNDLELQRLHALRLGICEKIEAGSLTLNQGMRIFEQEREKALQKRFEEEKEKKKNLVQ